MSTLDCSPPEIIEMITSNLSHEDRLALSQVSRRLRNFQPSCDIQKLTIRMFGGSLHLTTTTSQRSHAEQFVSYHPYCKRRKAKPDEKSEMIKCSRSFAFPPTEQYSIFPTFEARIFHVEMDKHYPVPLNRRTLDHLATLFSGCAVDKITLIVQEEDVQIIPDVPQFLASIFAKHVEFEVACLNECDVLVPFLIDGFAASLVRAGVRQVTFSHGNVSNNKAWLPESDTDLNKDEIGFALLSSFFDAGIESIRVNACACSRFLYTNRSMLECFLDKLKQMNKSVELQLAVLMNNYGTAHKPGFYKLLDGSDDKGVLVERDDRRITAKYRLKIKYQQSTIL